jgi:queuosine precursor transporter
MEVAVPLENTDDGGMEPKIVIYIFASLIAATVVCIASKNSRAWLLQVAYAALVVACLITASKLVVIREGFVVSVAIGLYSATFLLTDYLSEVYGKAEATRAIIMGMVAELLVMMAICFAIWIPPAQFWQNQAAMEAILGSTPRIMIASISAFVAAQFADVYIYHWIMDRTGKRMMWLRNNTGTIIAQGIDSVVFYSVAFAGVVPNLGKLILVTWVIKIVIALIDTPFLYAACRINHLAMPSKLSGDSKSA